MWPCSAPIAHVPSSVRFGQFWGQSSDVACTLPWKSTISGAVLQLTPADSPGVPRVNRQCSCRTRRLSSGGSRNVLSSRLCRFPRSPFHLRRRRAPSINIICSAESSPGPPKGSGPDGKPSIVTESAFPTLERDRSPAPQQEEGGWDPLTLLQDSEAGPEGKQALEWNDFPFQSASDASIQPLVPKRIELGQALAQLDTALATEDLSAALEKLKGVNGPVIDALVETAAASRDGAGGGIPGVFQQRAVRLLDLALGESDLAVVQRAYDWLAGCGAISGFGRDKEKTDSGESGVDNGALPRLVTPDVLKSLSGLSALQLSPKKWGASNTLLPLSLFTGLSLLLNNGIDVRPLVIVLLVLGVVDGVYLGGVGQAQALSLWPPHRRRVMVHEAGHVLAAYLLGCPVRGVVLDAFAAMDLGIQGQAGTQFWDSALDMELQFGQLSAASIDRYSVVLFAGVAAEALMYSEAEGGESDENLFKAFVGNLKPAWSPPKISNQARWAVLQAYTLLQRNRRAFDAVVSALEQKRSMGEIVLAIEMASTPMDLS